MGLFSKAPASDGELSAFATRQYKRRAESFQAQELIASTLAAGWTPEDVMTEFLATQWDIVSSETAAHFKDPTAPTRLMSEEALESALRAAAPAMFPLTWSQHVDGALAQLRQTMSS